MIRALTVDNYRSIRHLHVTLSQLNVVVGQNGAGKTNLYRAIELLHRAATGRLARTIADEGGMPSLTWAGPKDMPSRPGEPARKLGSRVSVRAALDDVAYEIVIGLVPPPGPGEGRAASMFRLDPEVKEERVVPVEGAGHGHGALVERKAASAWLRDLDGHRVTYGAQLSPSESVLAQLKDRHRYPDASSLVERLSQWRFYHHFRTDPDAPARHAQISVRTPVLHESASDLVAAVQTIREVGDGAALAAAITDAFPGARLSVMGDAMVRLSLHLEMPGLKRPLETRELSDGTLRYLCLAAALLSPRPPQLMVLNEPETSLHPQLLPPLARLLAHAASHTQLVVTTHSHALATEIAAAAAGAAQRLELHLEDGETRVRTEAPRLDTIDLLG